VVVLEISRSHARRPKGDALRPPTSCRWKTPQTTVELLADKSRCRAALKKISAWCKEHRHWRVSDQHVGLSRRVRRHDAYYGITGNSSSLSTMCFWVKRIWRNWLTRRSQRGHMPWDRFNLLLKRYPLPPPVAEHSTLRHAARP
jgi:hypothetical protein